MAGRPATRAASCRARATAGCWIAIVILSVTVAGGCNVNGALEQLSEARRLTAELLVQFTKAADAANRAVMADTDEASVAFAREAETNQRAVQRDIDALRPIVQGHYSPEAELLEAFVRQYAEYRVLDRRILDLAVENTNLKAQRLAFGPAQEAADSFRDALEAITPSIPAQDMWRGKALVATAISTVREIQVLQAPHIADADEAVMTRMESRMATSETAARTGLETLATLVPPASRARLAAATTALDRFMGLNAEIVGLSRRNTNVRSLALSLDQKRTLTATCESTLRQIQSALAKRGFTGTR